MQHDINMTAVGTAPPAAIYLWHKFITVLPDFILVTTAIYGVLSVALMVKKLRDK
jgi:Flp pilus assembly protein protease CpaA